MTFDRFLMLLSDLAGILIGLSGLITAIKAGRKASHVAERVSNLEESNGDSLRAYV